MLGPEGVARALVGRLHERLPDKLAEIRARLGVTAYELPDVLADNIHPTEADVLAIGQYPCIAVVEYDTSGRLGNQQTDLDAGHEEYQYKYRMRIYAFGMADGYVETDLLRKRLILAIREILLQDKVVHNDVAGGQYAEVDSNTLRESFSDVGSVEESQLLAGGYIEVEIASQERLAWRIPAFSEVPPVMTVAPDFQA
jgi:hypothetical protein